MRAKSNERHGGTTYGEQTIAKAIAGTRNVYKPREGTELRFRWMRLVCDFVSDGALTSNACNVGHVLAAHFVSSKTLEAFPTQETLARACGLSVRTVAAALEELELHGLVKVVRRGGGRPVRTSGNVYLICFPDAAADAPARDGGARARSAAN